jgi:gliding motility-associated-like protein
MICLYGVCSYNTLRASTFVADTIPPVIVTQAADQDVPCNAIINVEDKLTTWYNNHGGLVAEDVNSDTIIYSAIPDLATVIANFNASMGCGLEKSVSVNFYATDDCENTTPASVATFSIVDNFNPMIIKQATPVSVKCDSMARDSLTIWIVNHGGSSAADQCSAIDWLRFTYRDNLNNTGVGFIGVDEIPIPDGICNWRVDVSFIVVDNCGNQGVTTSFFEISDDVDPEFSYLPQDTVVGCEALPLLNDVIGTDYCTVEPVLNYTEEIDRQGTPDDCTYYNYTITRRWDISDNCGNTNSHIQVVTVMDTIAPQFALTDSVTVDCSELEDPQASYLPSNVMDNCSEVLIEITDVKNGEGCNYTIDRIYKFTDICGNSAEARQHIVVVDGTAPRIISPPVNIIVNCESEVITPFEQWVESFGNSVVVEDCNNLNSFAAVPGSYDIDNLNTYPGISPGSLDDMGCGGARDGFLFYEEVDFVFYDDCGNAVFITAEYGVTDNTPPIIESCPGDITIEADVGQCIVMFGLPDINVSDNCIETEDLVERFSRKDIVSPVPGSEDFIISPVKLTFSNYNPYFIDIIEDGTLHLDIVQADVNDPAEIFLVRTELNDTLGFTLNSPAQCGSASMSFPVPKEDIKLWLSDSKIDIFLIPLSPSNPSEGINDICPDASIRGTLSFLTNNKSILTRDVILDGNKLSPSAIINDSIKLDIGIHNIDYIISDCGKNRDTCSFEVVVLDTEPPVLTCPSDTVFVLNGASCSLDLLLPASYVISDNCALSKYYNSEVPLTDDGSLLNFRFSQASQSYLAQNVLLSFIEAFPILNTDLNAILEVDVYADISTDEFIEVKGEDGTVLGIINQENTDPCSKNTISFSIDRDKINQWTEDGIIDISFIPSAGQDINGGGINPCNPITLNGPDGVSSLKARLKYSDAEISYKVTGATSIARTNAFSLDTFDFTLSAGVNTITLYSSDLGGNETSCSFEVTVLDTFPPVVNCRNAVVFLDPSGVTDLVLDPSIVDNGSTDNCGIDSMAVEPSVFSCDMLGEEVTVTLTIWDEAGNSSSCESEIMLRTEVLQPTFEIGICDNDTLKLVANAPPSEVEDVYTFLWTGPDFMSVQENPIIPNATPENNGTYTLEITGFNGCVSTGTVEVNVEQLSSPFITTEVNQVCLGDPLLLTAAGQTGEVMYNWYEGTFPNGLLIETTEAPSLQITPTAGEHLYYLIIIKDGCESNPSPSKSVSVVDAPSASVIDEFITVCRGDAIVLGTEVNGDDITYQWTGPNGYTSDKQFPDSIFNSSPANEGIYSLVVSLGTCTSDTALLQVTLFEKPETPFILAGDVFCEGSSISLTVNNIPNADLYMWYLNGEINNSTSRNTLVLNNASEELSGMWTVIVTEGICDSEESAGKEITVESELLISANNNGPGCEGDSIQLTTSFVPGGNYSWTGPDGFTSTLQNPRISAVSGEYFITVTTSSGCDGESSTSVEVVSPPEITALSSDALECMDGMTDITLFPSVFPAGDYSYQWSGPGLNDTTAVNPVIVNATEANNGIYTLVVSSGICVSQPRGVEVDITIIPDRPIIMGDTTYCVDDTLKLSSSIASEGAQYLWSTPQGQRFTSEPELVIPFIEFLDMGAYSVVIETGNCRSRPSAGITVDIGELPLSPSISSNAPVCPGDTLKLFSTTLRNANYQWSGPNGFKDTVQNPVIPNVSSENEGDYVVVISSGACSEASQPFNVSIAEKTPTPQGVQEEYSLCSTNLESGLEICVENNQGQTGVFYSIYDNADDRLLVRGNSRCLFIDDLSSFVSGSNFVYIIAESESCFSDRSSLIRIDLIDPPIIDAEADENPIFVCDNSPVSLSAVHGPPQVNIEWTPLTEGLNISAPNNKNTNVSNLLKGENLILLTYSTEKCGLFSMDTIRVFLDDAPQVGNDNYRVEPGEDILLRVFDNDFIPLVSEINITEQPRFGTVTIEDEGILYQPASGFIGSIVFKYEVCGTACGGVCAEATVNISSGDPGECIAPTIITPNDDGVNDAFVIPCLYSGIYENSRLEVYNQWGSIVHSSDNYNNNWKGTYNGKPLPVGTYYYILRLGDGNKDIIGFLILER